MRRRSLLAASVAVAGTAITAAVTRPPGDDELLAAARRPRGDAASTATETILPGTAHETPLHVIDATADGPTAMVFGGVHGDERSGIAVAREATEWRPDAGRLVVVPETNRVAVENDRRRGPDGDLNRQFPADGEPGSDLAGALLDALENHGPDVVIDLHRSLGIYGVHPNYVGQAIFHSPGARADAVAAYLNEVAVPWYMPFHEFTAVSSPSWGPLLFHEANRALEATGYLVETTAFLLDRDARRAMTRLATAKILELHGLFAPGFDSASNSDSDSDSISETVSGTGGAR